MQLHLDQQKDHYDMMNAEPVLDFSGTFYRVKQRNLVILLYIINWLDYRRRAMLEISNCYKLLHLDEDCSDLELRRRFRKCALASHPDRLRSIEDDQIVAQPQFVRINDAYRKIVSYRKQLNSKKDVFAHQMDYHMMNRHLPSWEEIRQKLKHLNSQILNPISEWENDSAFGKHINQVYDDHMAILQNLTKRLHEMRYH